MLNSKTLRRAVGISQDDISGNAGPNVPSINPNGVIIGRFKRGRTDKPFKVDSKNFKALLGEDQNNPSYLIVQDAFIAGASELWILRIGKPIIKLSDGSEITDKKRFEQIAFESNLYPIPVFRDDTYNAAIELFDMRLKSVINRPADVIGIYSPSINHFNIEKTTFGKSFEFNDGYNPEFELLDSHLGSFVKKPVPIVDSYKSSLEVLSLSLRYGFKSFAYDEAYGSSVEQLNIERISKIKEKDINSRYTPKAEILDATLKQVLQVSSVEIGTDVYTQNYTLLDLTMSNVLVETAIEPEGYQAQPEPLSLVLKQALSVVDTNIDSGGYLPAIEPLSAHTVNKGQYATLNDGYASSLEQLDIEYVNYLAGGTVHEADSGYLAQFEVLNITKATLGQFEAEVTNEGYTQDIEPLNIFTTQRIK